MVRELGSVMAMAEEMEGVEVEEVPCPLAAK